LDLKTVPIGTLLTPAKATSIPSSHANHQRKGKITCPSFSGLDGRPQRSTEGDYCEPRRKNRLLDCEAVIVTELFVPSLETPALAVQLVKSGLCRNIKPVKEAGQEIVRPPTEGVTVNAGVAGLADGIGLVSRPRKSTLPVWVSRIKKRNG
jgi:hypothetical protein